MAESGMKRRCIWGLAILALSAMFNAAQAAESKSSPNKGEYILQRAPYGDEICKRFKDNLNRFRKLGFDTCHSRLSDKFPEFTRPYQWEEIPFDMALAEKAIKSSTWQDTNDPARLEYDRQLGQERWSAWLKSTAALRASGDVRMWITRIDIDDDGEQETILRLEPIGRYAFDHKQAEVYHCDYDRGELYVIDAKHPKTAGRFNRSANTSGDIIQDSRTGILYLLRWSRLFSGADVGVSLPWQGPMPDIGATRGVVLRSLSPRFSSGNFNPGVDVCIIDWVPTGYYKPAPKDLDGEEK
jgi:hypothetical protein